MLVLSRKKGERILIGENIVVTVCEVQHDKIRIGIDAPREIPIFREELLPGQKAETPQPVPAAFPVPQTAN